jgi:hypothetical protein
MGDVLHWQQHRLKKAHARVEADCVADIAALKVAISDLDNAGERCSPMVAAILREGAAKLARLVADLESELPPPS